MTCRGGGGSPTCGVEGKEVGRVGRVEGRCRGVEGGARGGWYVPTDGCRGTWSAASGAQGGTSLGRRVARVVAVAPCR
jgi:hypothetical protein